jgi:chemotaxis protein methyltransferase CheR
MDKPQEVSDPLGDPQEGHILTRAIIDTIHEPLIVLDENLRIIVASLSFYTKFNLTHENTVNKHFYDLGNGQWNIPSLRMCLEKVISEHAPVHGFEVEHSFPLLGLRTMLVNAREIRYENGRKKMLLSIFDITERRALEEERESLLRQKDLLLQEMKHRVANSLQLIASVLTLKAATIESPETRSHLQDAQERIMSIATVQQQLDPIYKGEDVPVAQYLQALCKGLARSMIGDRKPIQIRVVSDVDSVSSDKAVCFGLITTELVINAIKHAFPDGKEGVITVTYAVEASGWTLSVADNGVGQTEAAGGEKPGLGTSIIGALANQLHATIRTESSPSGMKVSLQHANL